MAGGAGPPHRVHDYQISIYLYSSPALLTSLSLSDGSDPDAPVAGGAGPPHRVHERRLPQVLRHKQGRQVYTQGSLYPILGCSVAGSIQKGVAKLSQGVV